MRMYIYHDVLLIQVENLPDQGCARAYCAMQSQKSSCRLSQLQVVTINKHEARGNEYARSFVSPMLTMGDESFCMQLEDHVDLVSA